MSKQICFTLYIFLLLFSSCGFNSKHIESENKQIEKTSAYFKVIFDPRKPGCGDCHNDQVIKEDNLASIANKKWVDHNFDINGTIMSMNDCLLCHSVDNEGDEGSIAPIPMRSIIHQAHKKGSLFEGDCFTCHYIMGDSSSDLYNYSD